MSEQEKEALAREVAAIQQTCLHMDMVSGRY